MSNFITLNFCTIIARFINFIYLKHSQQLLYNPFPSPYRKNVKKIHQMLAQEIRLFLALIN